jgi:protein O-GlcNAc transferase
MGAGRGRQKNSGRVDDAGTMLARGLKLHRAGEIEAAREIYKSILKIHPGHADTLHYAGLAAHQAADLEEAVRLLRESIRQRPTAVGFHYNLGVILAGEGDFAEAGRCFREAVRLQPQYFEAWFNLGKALKDSGQISEAAEAFRKAAQLNPSDADTPFNLGNTLLLLGRAEEAAARFMEAIRLRPAFADAYRNAARALVELDRPREAVPCLEQLLSLEPGDPHVMVLLGAALAQDNRLRESMGAFAAALTTDPADAAAHSNLAHVALLLGDAELAVRESEEAIRLSPDLKEAHAVLSSALRQMGRLKESAEVARGAIERWPSYSGLYDRLAVTSAQQGRLAEALVWLVRSVVLSHGRPATVSNLLYLLQYWPWPLLGAEEIDARLLLRLHRHWEPLQNGAVAPQSAFQNGKEPERRLKVGLVSADFRRHPVGYFVAGTLACLDKAKIDTVCYSDNAKDDDVTAAIRGACGAWKATRGLIDTQLAELIRADGIDVLIDLAGHTSGNRLPVFAARAAPVQASWAGYVGTTGVAAMDYLIADQFHVPAGEDALYTEKLVRLPDGYVCYAPPADAPEVAPPPCRENGRITFGCFNNLIKVNRAVMAVWADILKQVPEARLFLKTHELGDEAVREDLRRQFAEEGVTPERVLMEGFSPHAELLSAHARVDIGLDPFPYSGGLTTLEALWMGVPVITLRGNTFAGRHSTSHLHQVGLEDLVARDIGEYVAKGCALAGNVGRLTALRGTLRRRVRESPLCDHERFARHFEEAIRGMWREWCEAPKRTPRAAPRRRTAGKLRVAVVTPYYKGSEEVLRRCHQSVAGQSWHCTHFMVADGHPREAVQGWDVRHIVLPVVHGDNGNTPRAIGSIAALKEGFDAIAYLDSDNWFDAKHVEQMVSLHEQTGAAVCTSGRRLHALDGSPLPWQEGSRDENDGSAFTDTSCLFLTREAFRLLPLWEMMPKEFGPFCDRVFWKAVRASGLTTAHSPEPTVCFISQYEAHYRRAGLPVPANLKSPDEVARSLVRKRQEDEDATRERLEEYLRAVFTRLG